MAILKGLRGWWGRGGAIGESSGDQNPIPGSTLVSDSADIGIDSALQISAIWACIELRASTIASLPFFAYEKVGDKKEMATKSMLYTLLHESPNSRMTPYEFWRAMIMNHDLRGNGYARIDRDKRTGEAIALWPMPADQVTPVVLIDGSMVYKYQIGQDVAIIADSNCLHLKNLGNGTVGLSKLDFMRSTTDEIAKSQTAASKVFGTNGKPTGTLMLDKVLNPDQRKALLANFAGMAEGSASKLYLLEANMKYQQLSMSPADQQLLESRKYSVEEVCRWYATPPVLVHHSNVTTWGSGVDAILDGWYKLVIRPMLVSIEQATRKRVMTPRQRATMSIELAFDALLRGSLKDRMEVYSKAVQNGLKTRNECRQLENDPAITGADELTAQSNLAPLSMLGKIVASGGGDSNIAQ
jgi:HK97 family phage portal protein